MKNSFSSFTLLLGVWISDKAHLLVLNISPRGWISDGTLLLVFDISLLGDWISDEALPPVFNITSQLGLLLLFDITSLFLDTR